MYGIEFSELIRFFIQLSAIIAASFSLWGFVFVLKARKAGHEASVSLYKIAYMIMPALTIILVIFLLLWLFGALFLFTPEIFAHEGVAGVVADEYIKNGFSANMLWVWLLTVAGIIGTFFYFAKRAVFKKYAHLYFFSQFVLLSIIILLSVFTKELSYEQLSFFFHSWHSVITLGSIIVIDFLYLASLRKDNIKRVLYPVFPTISTFIWIGLGLDFLGSLLIFDGNFNLTPQFLFNQTVIAVIIINGVLLSGRINDALINLIKAEKVLSLRQPLKRIIRVSGAVSIISWLTVTFIDFFEFDLQYHQFFFLYLALIASAYIAKPFVERIVLSDNNEQAS